MYLAITQHDLFTCCIDLYTWQIEGQLLDGTPCYGATFNKLCSQTLDDEIERVLSSGDGIACVYG